METIPTAEEFLTLRVEHYKKIGKGGVTTAMIEFAKLHVTKALRQASEIVAQDRLTWEGLSFDCESRILNKAYSLDNIK